MENYECEPSGSSLIDPMTYDSSENEISLLSGNAKPASTDELKSMLHSAGTELTVKYITGGMTFEEFYAELERRKPKIKKSSQPSTSSFTAESHQRPNLPNFDQLMEDFPEDDGSNDEDQEKDNNDNVDDENEEDIDDDGARLDVDKNDYEYMPNDEEPKKGTEKNRKKREKEGLQFRRGPRKKRRGLYEIPKHLASQNGQAMLLRAQGKFEEAMKLLFDIIEKAPNSAAPFKTLGSIHEEKGDIEQALKFYMVSANLRKSDTSEWFDLVEMWVRLKDEKMVLLCFNKAFMYARTREDKLDVLSRRLMYYEEFGHPHKLILQCKGFMLIHMDPSKPEQIMEFARSLAKDYLEIEELNEAISSMLHCFQHLPKYIDSQDVHYLVELLMSQQNYIKSLEIIFKHCGVDVEMNNKPVDATTVEQILQEHSQAKDAIPPITKVSVPSLMPIDLRCKTMQCLILSKIIESINAFQDMLTDLMESDVEEYGDIYYDIAETMFENAHHEEAKTLLQKLISSRTYSKAAVWLTYGQCLNSLGEIENAAKAYSQVLELVPSHYEARLTLSSLEQQMGHHDKALELLSKADALKQDGARSDQLILLHRCQLLYSQGKIDDFIIAGCRLLSFNFSCHFSPEFMKALMSQRTTKHRTKVFQIVSNANKETQESEQIDENLSDIQKSERERFKKEIWDVYLKLCKEMHSQNRLDELVEISILGISCPTFCYKYTDSKSLDAEFLCLKVCVFSEKSDLVYSALKQCLSKEMNRNQAWNLYSYIVTIFRNMIDLRFAQRALMKNPNNIALGMLNGNARLISGTYIQALGEFLSVYRQNPENDMALFCCALSLAHITSQSFAEKRNLLIPQVLCLMNAYKDTRGENQETYYNMGRVLQQLNMPFAAVNYYKKALQFPAIIKDEQGRFDLSNEIAFNLSLIYSKSGNEDYARYYLRKYCVI